MKLKKETYYLVPECPPTEPLQVKSSLENANTSVQLIFGASSAYALAKKLGLF